MVYHGLMTEENRPKFFRSLYRILAIIALLTILIMFGYIAVQTANQFNPSIDFDPTTGLVVQVFIAHPDHGKITMNDRVLRINGVEPSAYDMNLLRTSSSPIQFEVQSKDGQVRIETIQPSKNTFLFLEQMLIRLIGVLFFLPGLILLFVKKPNNAAVLFFAFSFFLGLYLILGFATRISPPWIHSTIYLMLVLGGWSFIEFHWEYLTYTPRNWVKIGFRTIQMFAIILLFFNPIMKPATFSRLIDISGAANLVISFLLILSLFIIQLSKNEFRTGIVRTLFLSCLVAVLPMVIFTYLPFLLNRNLFLPAIIVTLPVLLIPVNYFILLMNHKQWVKISLVVLSFFAAIFTEQILVFAGNRWLPGGLPDYRVSGNWLNYLVSIGVLGAFLVLFSSIYAGFRRLIYGDFISAAAKLYRKGVLQWENRLDEQPLEKFARTFIQGFFRFEYLNICLWDGTVMQFDEENELRMLQVDEAVMNQLLERLAELKSDSNFQTLAERTIPLEKMDSMQKEFPQLFGATPSYIYLLKGSRELIGFISAGERKGRELFDQYEIEQLMIVLSQFEVIMENLLLVQQVEQSAQQIRLSGQQMLQMRENERKRIARDMHDNIIQAITAFRYQLNELYDSDKLSISDEESDELQHNLLNITQDIRDICFDLRPPALDATGLQSAVVSLVESYHQRDDLFINVEVQGEEIVNAIAEDVAICLYRVLQESLLNIYKHADTRLAHVRLIGKEDSMVMEVEDAGRGFEVPDRINELVVDGHFGLMGAQEFLDTVNGVFSVESVPGKGATIKAVIPLIREVGENGIFYDYRR